jgi:nucleotide-binding universal stress UspA family protein
MFIHQEGNMLNFKNILYPIDLDSKKMSSLEKALEFAKLFNCPIHILYVNDIEAGYRHPTDREDAVALKVNELVDESLLESMDIIYAVSKGEPAEEIVKYAQENDIDLIIIGHKHRGRLYAALFDSTDVHTIDKASLPVLVFPEK